MFRPVLFASCRPIARIIALAALGSCLVWVQNIHAQGFIPPAHPPIFNVPAGATPYSVATHAEADLLRGLGSLLVDESVARQGHAAAYEHELRNSLLQVEIYFERKRLHDDYTRKPSINERETQRYDSMRYQIARLPHYVAESDLAAGLNFILDELRTRSPSFSNIRRAPGGEAPELTGQQLAQLWFTNNRNPKERLTWHPSDGVILALDWPALLLADEFAALREEFTQNRDLALEQLRMNANIAQEGERLSKTVDDLMKAFDRYSKETHPEAFIDARVRRFLKNLKAQVRVLRETPSAAYADGSLRLDVGSYAELIQAMHVNGWWFAEPRDVDEKARYHAVFFEFWRRYVEGLDEEPQLPQPIVSEPQKLRSVERRADQ